MRNAIDERMWRVARFVRALITTYQESQEEEKKKKMKTR